MTRFEIFTADVESVAALIELATSLDLGERYCKNLPQCSALVDEDELPEEECRKCLIEWLNGEQENE